MSKRLIRISLVSTFAFLVLGIAVYFILGAFAPEKKAQEAETVSTGIAVEIPEEILENKFGFLGGNHDDGGMILNAGASWARPHPGTFLWDSMQGQSSKITFAETDEMVQELQEHNLGILITLWPYNDSDQEKRSDAEDCKVSSEDEFLPRGILKSPGNYLPYHRCNPHDWDSYAAWVKATVERYDGDGVDDMEGLKYPIKHWEVMNEPDISYENPHDNDRLSFYEEGPEEYAELLKKTNKAIKESDKDAKTLISGAAGGDTNFLDFYKPIFADKEAVKSFDIANVHCISNDDDLTYNVDPYKKLLTEYGIDKPIWVTEAEALMKSDTAEDNVVNTTTSVENALSLGAERIFFTHFGFEPHDKPGGGDKDEPVVEKNDKDKDYGEEIKEKVDKEEDKSAMLEEAAKTYREIIDLYN